MCSLKNCAYWKVNGIKNYSKWLEVSNFVSHCEVVCVAETKLSEIDITRPIKYYNHIRKDRPQAALNSFAGGLLVYIRHDIEYSSFDLPNVPIRMEYLAVRITGSNKNNIDLIFVNNPPNNWISYKSFISFMNSVSTL